MVFLEDSLPDLLLRNNSMALPPFMVVKRGHYTRFAGYGITRTLEGHDRAVRMLCFCKNAVVFGPIPQTFSTGSWARKRWSSRPGIEVRPEGLAHFDAIFATTLLGAN